MAREVSKVAVKVDPRKADHIPPKGTKLYKLLGVLLKGVEVDVGYAYDNLNLSTLQARCSELRRMGWPVRTLERPHPRLVSEMTTVYLLDTQFRRWLAANPAAHPKTYAVSDGRGKYQLPTPGKSGSTK